MVHGRHQSTRSPSSGWHCSSSSRAWRSTRARTGPPPTSVHRPALGRHHPAPRTRPAGVGVCSVFAQFGTRRSAHDPTDLRQRIAHVSPEVCTRHRLRQVRAQRTSGHSARWREATSTRLTDGTTGLTFACVQPAPHRSTFDLPEPSPGVPVSDISREGSGTRAIVEAPFARAVRLH
jgi:hypothetical protein